MSHTALRTRSLLALLTCALLAPACAQLELGRGRETATGLDAPDPREATRRETEAALAILERMSVHLASLPAFRFVAEIRYDAVQPSGQRIEFGSARRIAVRRPDRMRVDVAHWEGDRELLTYDGKHIWAASPTRGVYARIEHEGGIEQTLARMEAELDAPSPLAELVDPDLDESLRSVVESGARVGRVRLGGRLCDHLAFRAPALDFQVFVERGEVPLPRRLLIDYREEPGRPQFRASLHDWDLAPDVPDDFFHFAPALGAQRVPFGELIDLMVGSAPDRSSRSAP